MLCRPCRLRGPEEGPGLGRPAGLLDYRPPTARPGRVGVIYGAIDPSQDKTSPCCPPRAAAAQKVLRVSMNSVLLLILTLLRLYSCYCRCQYSPLQSTCTSSRNSTCFYTFLLHTHSSFSFEGYLMYFNDFKMNNFHTCTFTVLILFCSFSLRNIDLFAPIFVFKPLKNVAVVLKLLACTCTKKFIKSEVKI